MFKKKNKKRIVLDESGVHVYGGLTEKKVQRILAQALELTIKYWDSADTQDESVHIVIPFSRYNDGRIPYASTEVARQLRKIIDEGKSRGIR